MEPQHPQVPPATWALKDGLSGMHSASMLGRRRAGEGHGGRHS